MTGGRVLEMSEEEIDLLDVVLNTNIFDGSSFVGALCSVLEVLIMSSDHLISLWRLLACF